MDGSLGMVGRRIYRREFQRAISVVENIVPSARRHKDGIAHTKAALKVQFFSASAHSDKCLSSLYADELIRVRMNFHTDLAAGRDAH